MIDRDRHGQRGTTVNTVQHYNHHYEQVESDGVHGHQTSCMLRGLDSMVTNLYFQRESQISVEDTISSP